MAAGGEHDLVDLDLAAVRQLDPERTLRLIDASDGLAGDDPDAAFLHLAAQMGAQVLIEAAQDVLAAIDQRDLGAEAIEDGGELDRDIAAALNEHAVRQRLKMEGLVRGDHA